MLRLIVRTAMLAAFVALPVAPALAQTTPAPAAAPDPTRLAAAQALMETMIPTDRREAMVEQTVRPMMDNLRTAMLNAPAFEAAQAKNPKFTETMDQFLKEEFERSIALTKSEMPKTFDAMARAYARRFTLDQLKAIAAFFETPAGRAYADQASTIMADPDVQAVQRAMMTKTMSGMQERIAAFAAKLGPEAGSK